MKEFKTKDGRSFYSEWAFDVDSNEKSDKNYEVFDSFRGHYCYPMFNQTIEECIAKNPNKLVLNNIAFGKSSNKYMVCANPENLSMAEIALIADYGNICFGFDVIGNIITIYTD